MARDFIWEVDTHTWDYLNVLAGQRANETISEVDYLDKLRSRGFPAEAQPGDNIRIRLSKPAQVQVNRNGSRVLPGLPN